MIIDNGKTIDPERPIVTEEIGQPQHLVPHHGDAHDVARPVPRQALHTLEQVGRSPEPSTRHHSSAGACDMALRPDPKPLHAPL
jgi:hypothetical protein